MAQHNLPNPLDVYTKETIVGYDYYITELVLHEKACFSIEMKSADGRIIDFIHITIEGDEYNNWGNDDNYIQGIIEKYVNDFIENVSKANNS